MGNLQIKDIPEPSHAELRRRARAEGISMRDYALRLIERDQRTPPLGEWLERVAGREPVEPGESAAEAIAADRAERDAELERGAGSSP